MYNYSNSWYAESGVLNDIVLYTKTSIGRNISGFIFPSGISHADSSEVLSLVFSYMESMPLSSQFNSVRFKDIDPLGLKLLEERGAINTKIPQTPEKGVIVHNNGSLYVNVNTEDHVNINSFRTGFDIERSYFDADNLESGMQDKIFFEAKEDFGYICSDIMNIGSGVKFSVLCSLPAILYSKKISEAAEIARTAGLIVSGYYSENSKESLGALFSISSGICAGGNVQSQMSEFISAINKIIKMEESLRQDFVKKNFLKVEDMIGRAFAISQRAKLMSYKESVDLIFKIKFGLNLGLLSGISHEKCNAILFNSQVGHLASFLLSEVSEYNYDVAPEVTESSLEEYRAKMLQKECCEIKINF